LAVALELFADQGYAASTIGQIADRSAVTPPALYYHFASKEALVHELVDPHLDELEAVVPGNGGSPPRGELLRRYAGVVSSAPAIARFLDRDAAGLTQVGITQRHEAVNSRVEQALADAGGDGAAVAEASAAIAAVRKLVSGTHQPMAPAEAAEVGGRAFRR